MLIIIAVLAGLLLAAGNAEATNKGCTEQSYWTVDHHASYTTLVDTTGWISAKLTGFFSDDFIHVSINGKKVYDEPFSGCNPSNHYGIIDIPITFSRGSTIQITTTPTCQCGCDQPNAAVQYTFTYCTDFDGDGHNHVKYGGDDCNDDNPGMYPGATDIPGNGIDEDCSGGDRVTQCSDGFDDDGDGAVDYPADFSCSSLMDDDETLPMSDCQDGIDNDGDLRIDYPGDPGCASLQEDNELTGEAGIACDDGIDNDGDGLADMNDPGCVSPRDKAETEPGMRCDDGIDNDFDGLID